MTSVLEPSTETFDDDPCLSVEEIAYRLALPLPVLLRRVEAGDIPAQREEGPDGVRWSLRLSDLGLDRDARALALHRRPAPAVISGDDEEPVMTLQENDRAGADATEVETPPPPPFLHVTEPEAATEVVGRAATPAGSDEPALPPPPPSREADLALFDYADGPRAEVAAMSLDPRELVAGLLDRWERSLEQRIYAEQRQRFEGELVARQNLVKSLRMELQTARAEHAAAQAEKDRIRADLEHTVSDRERDLRDRERELEETHRRLAELEAQRQKRRGWFFRR